MTRPERRCSWLEFEDFGSQFSLGLCWKKDHDLDDNRCHRPMGPRDGAGFCGPWRSPPSGRGGSIRHPKDPAPSQNSAFVAPLFMQSRCLRG